MVLVRFEPSRYEVEVAPGARIVDVTDDHPRAEVPYSCRAANCGTCRVEVKEGLSGFAEADDEELGVLDIFGDNPNKVRLCCQLKLVREVPRVVLRVIEP